MEPSADKIAAAQEMRRLWEPGVSAAEFSAMKTMDTEDALAIMDDAYRAEKAMRELLERQYKEAIETNQLNYELYIGMIEKHFREREALND
jgi:hypothetical protein